MLNPEQFLSTYDKHTVETLKKQYQSIFCYDNDNIDYNDFVLWSIQAFLTDYKFKCLISKLQENA